MPSFPAELLSAVGDAYAVDRELGGGGMSRVFLAPEIALGRRVVIKVLPADEPTGSARERFRREVLVAARLQHPHLVPLHSSGEARGVLWFVTWIP